MSEKYLDEVFDSYYNPIGPKYRSSYLFGQFFWTHVLYALENLEFWRPVDYDETKTHPTEFEIATSTDDAFNRPAPLYTPKLEIDEELIVLRAKRRPVILIVPAPERIALPQIRGGGRVHRNLAIVAPLYSVATKEGKAKYHPDFINMIRTLEFPHLFFCPSYLPIRDSICRLDSIQTSFLSHLEPIDLRLCDEVLNVFKGQLEHHLTGRYYGEYRDWRGLLYGDS